MLRVSIRGTRMAGCCVIRVKQPSVQPKAGVSSGAGNIFIRQLPSGFKTLVLTMQELSDLLDGWSTDDLTIGVAVLAKMSMEEAQRSQVNFDSRFFDAIDGAIQLKDAELQRSLQYYLRLAHASYTDDETKLFDPAHTNFAEEDIVAVSTESDASVIAPAYFVAIDRENKNVVVSIRGTEELADALIDAMAAPEDLYTGYGHRGIVHAAEYIIESLSGTVYETLQQLHREEPDGQDYGVRVIGHSLGAGTAAMVTMAWHKAGLFDSLGVHVRGDYAPDINPSSITHDEDCVRRLPAKPYESGSSLPGRAALHCIAFCPPSCVSADLAWGCMPYVTSVVHGDDIVPRFHLHSMEILRQQLNNVDWKAELRRRAMNEVGESKVGKLADKARKSVTGSAKTVQDAVDMWKTQVQKRSKIHKDIKARIARATDVMDEAAARQAEGNGDREVKLSSQERSELNEIVGTIEEQLADFSELNEHLRALVERWEANQKERALKRGGSAEEASMTKKLKERWHSMVGDSARAQIRRIVQSAEESNTELQDTVNGLLDKLQDAGLYDTLDAGSLEGVVAERVADAKPTERSWAKGPTGMVSRVWAKITGQTDSGGAGADAPSKSQKRPSRFHERFESQLSKWKDSWTSLGERLDSGMEEFVEDTSTRLEEFALSQKERLTGKVSGSSSSTSNGSTKEEDRRSESEKDIWVAGRAIPARMWRMQFYPPGVLLYLRPERELPGNAEGDTRTVSEPDAEPEQPEQKSAEKECVEEAAKWEEGDTAKSDNEETDAGPSMSGMASNFMYSLKDAAGVKRVFEGFDILGGGSDKDSERAREKGAEGEVDRKQEEGATPCVPDSLWLVGPLPLKHGRVDCQDPHMENAVPPGYRKSHDAGYSFVQHIRLTKHMLVDHMAGNVEAGMESLTGKDALEGDSRLD